MNHTKNQLIDEKILAEKQTRKWQGYFWLLFMFLPLFVVLTKMIDWKSKDSVPLQTYNSISITYETLHHSPDSIILQTSELVFVKNKLVKTIVHKDTLPSLGDTMVVGTNQNDDKQVYKQAKDYKLFITVK